LDQTDDRQQNRAPDADALIGRHEADGHRRNAGYQQGCYQRRLTSDAIPPMPEDRRSDWPADKADEKDGEGFEHADYRVRFGEEELAEDKPRDLAVKQEIVPFNRGPDRAGDQSTAQLRTMFEIGKPTRRDIGCRHRISPHSSAHDRDRCHAPPDTPAREAFFWLGDDICRGQTCHGVSVQRLILNAAWSCPR
jgi:hypothetical protein